MIWSTFKANKKSDNTEEQKKTSINIVKLYDVRKDFFFFNYFTAVPYEAWYNAINAIKGEGIKISTPKQMLQILTIAHAKVKEGNTLKNLLNKIRQIVYSLY